MVKKKGPTAKRYDEKVKKQVALAIAKGKMSVAEARREYDILGGQTIKGWLAKYAPGFKPPRSPRGPSRTKGSAKKVAKGAARKAGKAAAPARKGRPTKATSPKARRPKSKAVKGAKRK